MKDRFGKPAALPATTAKPRAKPLKRPSQARAIFTVEVLYEAFVRIWRRDGWAALTTRAVALEAGFAVGTLYDYFPSKEAMLSGYVRHGIEALLQRIDHQVVQANDLGWEARIRLLVKLTYAMTDSFSPELLRLEYQIAEAKHHQRFYQELCGKWCEAFAACGDIPTPPSRPMVEAWAVMVWGGLRYGLTAQLCPEQWALLQEEAGALMCARVR